MPSYSLATDRWLTFGLAFVGGYGDASGLLLANTFTGHITGNLVLVAIAAVSRDIHGVERNIGAIVTFLLGIFLSAALDVALRRRPAVRLISLVIAMEIVLVSAAAFILNSEWDYKIAAFIVCVALALGMQNGALRSLGGTTVHTTYVTGMVTNLISTAASKELAPSSPPTQVAKDPTPPLLLGIWLAFLLGAGTGAAMISRFHGLGLLGVVGVLIILLLRSRAPNVRPTA